MEALDILEREKEISKETLFEAIENSLLTACKNHFGKADNIFVQIDRETCDFLVYAEKEVVATAEEVEDDCLQISLEDAQKIKATAELGDVLHVEIKSKEFGRIATQNAKNVILQKIREEERSVIYNQYFEKEKDIVNFWNHTVFHPTNLIEDPMGQLHLNKLAQDKAVQIVRIYTMFEESVTLDENGQMQYDFSMSDYRIDELLKRGFTPYLVYGFFPGFLSAEQDDKQDEMLISHRYKNNLLYRSYMTDYNKWGQICYHYTKHLLERYGEDRVSTWYIHCYNEPDLGHFFYKNAPSYRERAAEYCKMYAELIRCYCSEDEAKIEAQTKAFTSFHFEHEPELHTVLDSCLFDEVYQRWIKRVFANKPTDEVDF